MIKRIKTLMMSLLLVITGSIYCSPVYGAVTLSERDVVMTQNTEYKGGVFYKKNPSWQLEITNSAANELKADMTAVIKDLSGSEVWRDTEGISIEPNTKKVFAIGAELSDYGIYTIAVTLSGDFGTIARNENFSCVRENAALNDFVGVQAHFVWSTRDYPEGNLPTINSSGFGVVRDHIEWPLVDTTVENGIPDNVIDFVDKINASGQKLILVIGNSNPEYDNGGLPVSDDALKTFGEFCGYVAERLKGKVYAYEIWNEPDYFSAFTNGIANTGTQYCKLLETAYNAIDAVDKEALILGGALTAIGYTSLGFDNAALNYMQEMLGAGAAKYMDAFSFHPYANTGYLFDENIVQSRSPESQLALARKTLDAYGATSTPIWITEIGASSYIDNDGTDEGYTELEQAINLQRMVMIARAEKSVIGMSIYNHREKGTNPNDFEQNFGIINNDYTAKPAFVGLSFLNALLIDAEYAEDTAEGTLSIYRFKDKYDGSDIFSLWTKGGGEKALAISQSDIDMPGITGNTFSYPMGCELTIFDMYGNLINDESLRVGAQPVYIKCTQENPKPEIVFEDGHMTISGKINDDSGAAAIVVYKNLLDAKEIVGIKQIKAERSRGYTAEFELNENTLYGICVYNGEKYNDFVNGSAYDIDIELYKGNEKIESMDAVADGDEVTAVMSVADTTRSGAELSFFGVLYGKDGVLIEAESDNIQWNSEGVGGAETAFWITDKENVKLLKLMLWDESLRPIINPITLKG